MAEDASNRGSTWDDEEVLALINIWADERIQQELDSCSRKKPVFQKISNKLSAMGYTRSHQQIREKIKQLKKKYKKVKDNNNRSGQNRISCTYFQELDSILGDRPITRPPDVLESSDAQQTDTAEFDDFLNEDDILNDNSTDDFHVPTALNPVDEDDIKAKRDDTSEMLVPENNASGSEKVTATGNKSEKRPALKQGVSKKKSKRDSFLSDVCGMLQKQQQVSDDRFFKLEAERQEKEDQKEDRRRKEDREHEMAMMQMVGNMFMQATANVNTFPHQNQPLGVPQQGQFYYPSAETNSRYQPQGKFGVLQSDLATADVVRDIVYTNLS